MQAWDYLRQLSELPPRGTGSAGERGAAEWLRERMERLGYDVEMQPFTTPRYTLYAGPATVAATLVVAILLAKAWPAVALVLAVLSFVPLLGEMLGTRLNFNLFLPKSPSQNVFAKPRPGGAADLTSEPRADPLQDIILVAHYDTQWGSWLFAPWFRPILQPFFFATYGALGLALVAIILCWSAPTAAATPIVANIALVMLIVTGGFLLLSGLTGKAVPGANDNGSGVAVALAVADEWARRAPEDIRLSFLFTGAEEVGLRGMHHFVALTRGSLQPNTLFVNIDNVGGGRLRYLLGEGMLGYQHYDAGLIAIAQRTAETFDKKVLPLKNLLLPTDALAPAKAGYAAITFIATNADESIANYHWHTDTFKNADRYTVDQTERFVKRYIEALAARTNVKVS